MISIRAPLVCMTTIAMISAAAAQTANSSPTAPSSGGRATSTVGPSGGTGTDGTAAGGSKIGPETQVEKQEQEKSKQDTTICKGC
ncbi:MAG: hypothetical protein INR70_41660 [Parafilimonas terrae]|nr:hypothetical protein [Parafilimonas terrae]